MTPDGAVRLLERYEQVQSAIARDAIDEAQALLDETAALIAEPTPPDADRQLLHALATQAAAALADATSALAAARARLLRAAQLELRPGGDAATAYAGPHERPAARFIDHTG